MRDTKAILTAWKHSRVLKRIGTEYPYKSAVLQGAKSDIIYRQYLTEEECDVVDNALLALREDDYNLYSVINAIYMKSFNCNKLAEITGIRKATLYNMLNEAEKFIRGYIYPFFREKDSNQTHRVHVSLQ